MITEIVANKGKARVYFDGVCRLTVRERDLRTAGIKADDEIEPEECIGKLAAVQFNACYEAALCVLDVSAQTRSSMIRKLRMKGFVDPVCDAVAQKLAESGLIDEQRFAECIATNEKNKASGKMSVRRKMLSKGLDADTVEEAMSDFDDAQQMQACRKAILPLLRRYRELEPAEARKKIAQTLMRKGFSWDVCSEVINSSLNETEYE